jgi:hypothetical protein
MLPPHVVAFWSVAAGLDSPPKLAFDTRYEAKKAILGKET